MLVREAAAGNARQSEAGQRQRLLPLQIPQAILTVTKQQGAAEHQQNAEKGEERCSFHLCLSASTAAAPLREHAHIFEVAQPP